MTNNEINILINKLKEIKVNLNKTKNNLNNKIGIETYNNVTNYIGEKEEKIDTIILNLERLMQTTIN